MSPSTDIRDNRPFACEIKFILTPERADAVRQWARARLGPDPNAGGASGDTYLTTSLYFDTVHFDVLHRNGSFARSKYRIRRYGEDKGAFLERKLKTRNLVGKRRSKVDLQELARIESGKATEGWTGYWFHRRLIARKLGPVCQVSYHRTARVSQTSSGPIRLTLDQDVRALAVDGVRFPDSERGEALIENRILELKYLHSMPSLFKQLLEEFALDPAPISKYRLAAASLYPGAAAIIPPPIGRSCTPLFHA